MKSLKPKYSGGIILIFLIILSNLTLSAAEISYFPNNGGNIDLKTSALGVSNDIITQSVNYTLEINLTITQVSGSNNYYLKYPRLNDRQPNSALTEYTPSYQESTLLYNSINAPSTYIRDKFNNTYDLFNKSLSSSQSLSLSQKYKIKLNEITFGNIESLGIDMSDYNLSDPMFSLYGNHSMPYYETNESVLIAASKSIADSYSNPAMKAQKIIEFVSSYLTYEPNMPAQEKGAYWAFTQPTPKGDCSEYSDLAITLMRIQGIPARKVTGNLADESVNFRPYIGYSRTFTSNDVSDNFLGHAWVEYYIPTVGWVSCEPQRADLWKTSSYSRFTQNIGQWFEFPGGFNISEYNYLYISSGGGTSSFSYTWKYIVDDVNLYPGINFIVIIVIIIIIGAAIVVSIIILRYVVKKRRNYSEW